jgi:hypothetical protein
MAVGYFFPATAPQFYVSIGTTYPNTCYNAANF